MNVEGYLVQRIEDIADSGGRNTIYSVVDCIQAERANELKAICQGDDRNCVRIFEAESQFTFMLFYNNGFFSKAANEKDGDGDDDVCLYIPAYVFTDVVVRIIAAVALQVIDTNYLKRHLLGLELNV